VSARILVVEDESDLARTIAYALRKEGYSVTVAGTGKEGLVRTAEPPAFDLVVLDLMLPDLSGTEVCRHLRADPHNKDVLVLMLTARGEEIDRVVGFEVGADDYVVKPFSVRELSLRIKALLRRTSTAPDSGPLAFGRLRLDPAAHSCWVDEERVALTAIEIRLLGRLLGRRGLVQTRAQLLDAVWGETSDVHERTVDANVKRLREKLGEMGDFIETLRGVGYRFAEVAVPRNPDDDDGFGDDDR
jgi:two-component system phosphate regulon response regulator PhoB